MNKLTPHWLVVWGDGIDQIRAAKAKSEKEAMLEAYGMAVDNMTVINLTRDELRSTMGRRRKICEMLVKHRKKFVPGTKLYERDEEQCQRLVQKIDDFLKDINRRYK